LFIPIKDDIPTLRRPYLTVALIVINALVFLYSIMQGSRGFQLFTYQYGFIPYEIVKAVELTPQLPASIYLTPFTSMFMHGGWMHLIGNMLFLWIFGNNVEDYFGHVVFLIFYLLSGLCAVGLYTLFGPLSQVPMIGASGAIAGVMGAYMVLYPRRRWSWVSGSSTRFSCRWSAVLPAAGWPGWLTWAASFSVGWCSG
jgi:membrane associated rhomboid family serine protease